MARLTINVGQSDGVKAVRLLAPRFHHYDGDMCRLVFCATSPQDVVKRARELADEEIPFIATHGPIDNWRGGGVIVGGAPNIGYYTHPQADGEFLVPISADEEIDASVLNNLRQFLTVKRIVEVEMIKRRATPPRVEPPAAVTKEEFIEDCGEYCPWCRSEDFHGETDFPGSGLVLVSYSCMECGHTWTEKYKLYDAEFE
ncbi:MAG: hypothetical protein GF350_10415 [Chitinivibrionales bacterium]|nr:hypothetical protein [Chitinivibrionales bacterium]